MIVFASHLHCEVTSETKRQRQQSHPRHANGETCCCCCCLSEKEVHKGLLHTSEQECVANHSRREDNSMANVSAGLEIESVINCALNDTLSCCCDKTQRFYDCPTFVVLDNRLETHLYFHFVECPKGLFALARKTSLSPCLSRVVVIGQRGFLLGDLPVLFNNICSSCKRIDVS